VNVRVDGYQLLCIHIGVIVSISRARRLAEHK
jgi:hypothetical protein